MANIQEGSEAWPIECAKFPSTIHPNPASPVKFCHPPQATPIQQDTSHIGFEQGKSGAPVSPPQTNQLAL